MCGGWSWPEAENNNSTWHSVSCSAAACRPWPKGAPQVCFLCIFVSTTPGDPRIMQPLPFTAPGKQGKSKKATGAGCVCTVRRIGRWNVVFQQPLLEGLPCCSFFRQPTPACFKIRVYCDPCANHVKRALVLDLHCLRGYSRSCRRKSCSQKRNSAPRAGERQAPFMVAWYRRANRTEADYHTGTSEIGVMAGATIPYT